MPVSVMLSMIIALSLDFSASIHQREYLQFQPIELRVWIYMICLVSHTCLPARRSSRLVVHLSRSWP